MKVLREGHERLMRVVRKKMESYDKGKVERKGSCERTRSEL